MPDILNAEVLQSIAHNAFYGELLRQEELRVYPKLCELIDQDDLTTTYTSFGSTPEPRQLSGSVASGGQRHFKRVRDYKITGTVVEWEQTVEIDRAVIETNPNEVPRRMREMAAKASIFMDRRFVGTILPASTAGYDGVGIYSASHPESGTNQDNDDTSAAATGTKPSAAELESHLDTELGTLCGFTDDEGTPVNAGVQSFFILVPKTFRYLYKTVLEPATNQERGGLDSSGGSGRFRGMFQVLGSPFVATEDRHYIFTNEGGGGRKAVALLKNKDFEFVTNIGTDSDRWRHDQKAVFSSYARFEFIPWDWKCTYRQVWT